jgi:hypothetical protein
VVVAWQVRTLVRPNEPDGGAAARTVGIGGNDATGDAAAGNIDRTARIARLRGQDQRNEQAESSHNAN